jgi:hypothetical protein
MKEIRKNCEKSGWNVDFTLDPEEGLILVLNMAKEI